MTSSPFPCVLEQTVASALLQLSSSSLSPSPSKYMEIASFEEENVNSSSTSMLQSTESRSCTSSLTSNVASDELHPRKLRVIAGDVRRRRGFKLKVARRTRCRLDRKCTKQQSVKASKAASLSSGFRSGFGSAKTVSCLSSSSSEDSSARSLGSNTSEMKNKRTKVPVASSHMRRRAEAILEFLSTGSANEVRIRQVLGDSPDTSKALRMLLRSDKVRRSGTGGRHDPYVYMISQGTTLT